MKNLVEKTRNRTFAMQIDARELEQILKGLKIARFKAGPILISQTCQTLMETGDFMMNNAAAQIHAKKSEKRFASI